ncbi:MAG: hypothetical protein GKR98_17650 [Boseongicola sp.]|nr:MAG: hypothetical protein GKR98_17650 [Boseongicola sp.]
MSRIILPQVFKATLPSTINQIVIIGFYEVLASDAAAFGTAERGIATEEVNIFIGILFFVFSHSLSRYGTNL